VKITTQLQVVLRSKLREFLLIFPVALWPGVHSVTYMNAIVLSASEGSRRVRQTNSLSSVIDCLDDFGASRSQKTYGPAKPVTEIALP
jgi:hypothetical protein